MMAVAEKEPIEAVSGQNHRWSAGRGCMAIDHGQWRCFLLGGMLRNPNCAGSELVRALGWLDKLGQADCGLLRKEGE